ncbi:efflux RND transporter periplasmic adaptor subunit [Bradyrhizobium canariense]|uniref:HlyD family secretion protein n=1 Tax=Bradyrhizobium canariense TaxID=255045 RepID=A0A1H1ZW43_9BRAD|nr:efflux RND transporter periplasmic adaptor subunit [Bradyrhizobium canariense]SDT37948.1 HlyD family secretion protein [Bradyrhizobium canariense]
MKILLVNSLILSSVVAWPATSWWHAPNTGTMLASLPGIASSEPDYVTSSVKVEDVVKTIMATGALIPSLNVEVGSVLSGQIAKLKVDFNDKIVKGQVLAELDPRTFELAVASSQAALEGARADLRAAEVRLERSRIQAKQTILERSMLATRVDRAKVAFDVADREYKRKQWLLERNAAPATEVQDSQSRLDAANAALRESQVIFDNQANAIDAANADIKRAMADIGGLRASVDKASAQLQTALTELDRTKIKSPVDGVIVGRSITEGQTLATGLEAKTLFTIAGDLSHMEINARVDESDIAKIKVGQNATFTVDSFPGRTFEATVRQIRMAPQVLQNVVTYTVVLTTENPDYALLPGMTVLAKIVTERTPASMTVPLAALRFRPQAEAAATSDKNARQASLWVLRSGHQPRRISVVRGDDNGTNVAIKSDELQAADRIVIGENAQGSDKDVVR